MTATDIKTCRLCGIGKPISDFHLDQRTVDGHTSDCKKCACARARRCRSEKLEHWREHDRLRAQTAQRKAADRVKVAKLRKKYPEKWAARYAVDNAIRKGALKRGCCEVCGDPNTEGHHADYSKQLDVIWLCKPHHRELHQRENALQDA